MAWPRRWTRIVPLAEGVCDRARTANSAQIGSLVRVICVSVMTRAVRNRTIMDRPRAFRVPSVPLSRHRVIVLNRFARVAVLCLAALVSSRPAAGQARGLPESLTDREFWQFFTAMSEDAGTFPSENFVSNEKLYQYVIPEVQRTLTQTGVYLGVGPEQN